MNKLKHWFDGIYELIQDIAEEGDANEKQHLFPGDTTALGRHFSKLGVLAEAASQEEGDIAEMADIAAIIREELGNIRPYNLLNSIITLLGAPELFIQVKKITRTILIVAKQGYGEKDWGAYIRTVPGDNHQKEAALVMVDGEKIDYSLAKVLFPRFDYLYEWRS